MQEAEALTESFLRERTRIALGAPSEGEREVVAWSDRSELTRFAASQISQNVAEVNASVSVRCAVGKRVGWAVTSSLHPDEIRRCVERARAAVRSQPENPHFRGLPPPSPVSVSGGWRERTASKSSWLISRRVLGVRVRTVAARGEVSMRAISPKNSPGP